MPRLADCSSGRTEMGFCVPCLAASACACAAIEPDNAPTNVAPSSRRWPSGQLILGFIHASMERIPSGFKAAISSPIRSQIQIQPPVQDLDPFASHGNPWRYGTTAALPETSIGGADHLATKERKEHKESGHLPPLCGLCAPLRLILQLARGIGDDCAGRARRGGSGEKLSSCLIPRYRSENRGAKSDLTGLALGPR